ncbi:hypothetical protein JAO82_12180 [Pontibaca sp. S1109L]|uniref:HTH DNA binding domain-containing protein n=1 Tax=Pontibaca salina TaxID=2795731 RepID=A0A934HTT4_9RHOB|nr:hypothetical protein [Pontibaca salina]MBI6630635.1 hypothetical protein [Pontibaca salina]
MWFRPDSGQPDPEFRPPGPQTAPQETAILADWAQAEAGHAAHLAQVAGRLGALGDRLQRAPHGWRHRLALLEAAELSWVIGARIGPDRLALWISMHLSSVQDDTGALARVGWAVRRLTGGPGPEADLVGFLERRDPESRADDPDGFAARAQAWLDLLAAARALHPITRAAMGVQLWNLAGLDQPGDRLEAAVTAGRIAAGDGNGAVFAPLALGGAGGLHAGGPPAERLGRWLDGMQRAIQTAMRQLDDIESWAARAETAMAPLSGRTGPALRAVLVEWPLVSAPMAETLTGASRAAVQRNLARMEASGLVHEVTGQGRFRLWRAATAKDRGRQGTRPR